MQEFVFCRALQDVVGLSISAGQQTDMRRGDTNILQYRAVRQEVLRGAVQLL